MNESARVPGARRARLHRVWSEVWRLGVALLTGIILLGVIITEAEDGGWLASREGLYALDALIGLVSVGLLLLRRRFPFAVAMVLSTAGLVSTSSAGAAGIALVSLATHRRWRPTLAVAVPWVGAGIVYERLVNPTPASGDPRLLFGFGVAVYALCVAVGYYIGTRRELLQRLRERAEAAELQQSLRVAQARIAERHRIAREMHDVLAHRISLIAMHSGALAFRSDLAPGQVSEAAGLIRDTSHQALEELRTVLGVLREEGGAAADHARGAEPEPPQPTLADLDELVAENASVGGDVDLDLAVATLTMPVTLSRNAFRIVQEALTNARKHAPGERVQLSVSGGPGDGLRIRARNGIPVPVSSGDPAATLVPGAGLGLAGATERATLAGGRLDAGVDRAGDFVLEAWLPWAT